MQEFIKAMLGGPGRSKSLSTKQISEVVDYKLCGDTIDAEAVPCNPNHVNDISEIPAERMQKMQVHYAMLKKKFPHMKDKRIARKVAEEFKIKLV